MGKGEDTYSQDFYSHYVFDYFRHKSLDSIAIIQFLSACLLHSLQNCSPQDVFLHRYEYQKYPIYTFLFGFTWIMLGVLYR